MDDPLLERLQVINVHIGFHEIFEILSKMFVYQIVQLWYKNHSKKLYNILKKGIYLKPIQINTNRNKALSSGTPENSERPSVISLKKLPLELFGMTEERA